MKKKRGSNKSVKTIEEEYFRKIIGVRIEMKRKIKHLSQQQLADEVGLSRSAIANIEAGSSMPPIYKLMRIGKAVKASMATLLKGF